MHHVVFCAGSFAAWPGQDASISLAIWSGHQAAPLHITSPALPQAPLALHVASCAAPGKYTSEERTPHLFASCPSGFLAFDIYDQVAAQHAQTAASAPVVISLEDQADTTACASAEPAVLTTSDCGEWLCAACGAVVFIVHIRTPTVRCQQQLQM